MPSPPPIFAQPDLTTDGSFILVLIEATGLILNFWDAIKTHYLPNLLSAIQAGNKTRPVRVCWQMTSDPPGQPGVDTEGAAVPDFTFDLSATCPIGRATLRRSLETIKGVPREHGWTRHLIVVAISPPFPDEVVGNSHHPGTLQETCEEIARALSQEGIRTHMVLSAAECMRPLREVHASQLRSQGSNPLHPWFYVDPHKFTVHLSPVPYLHDPKTASRSVLRLTSTPDGGLVSAIPTSSSPGLPIPSPSHETAGLTHSLSPSPPSRRTRMRTDTTTSSSPPSPSAAEKPRLVTYLQKMHGMTKKRAPSVKTKKSPTSEPARPSTSSRPILPKLTLPAQNAGPSRMPEILPRATTIEIPDGPGTSSSSSLTGASTSVSSADRMVEHRKHHLSARWPFLKLAPMTSVREGPGFSESASAALRSLDAISPRSPLANVHPSTEMPQYTGEQFAAPYGPPPQHNVQQQYAMYGPGPSNHVQMQTVYATSPTGYQLVSDSPPYQSVLSAGGSMSHSVLIPHDNGSQLQPSTPIQTEQYAVPSGSPLPHGGLGSPATTPPLYATNTYPYGQPVMPATAYSASPSGSQSSTPLTSPSITAPAGATASASASASAQASGVAAGAPVDEGEDQPFVITPEYEAFANARFEAAVRSGAIAMSSTTGAAAALSPSIEGTFAAAADADSYFAVAAAAANAHAHASQVAGSPDRVSGPALQQGQMMAQPDYGYAFQQEMPEHELYQQASGSGVGDPGQPTYYSTSPSGPQWYGP